MVAIPAGDFTLEGEVRLREGAPGVVLCHPHPAFGGRMDNLLLLTLDDALSAAGFSTLRFNFRGLGASGGTPTGGEREHEDVRAAAAFLRARASRVALVGYSFGALMAMRALAEGEQAAAAAAIGLPTSIVGDHPDRLAHVERALGRELPWLLVHGDADPFCEPARIAGWTRGRPEVRVDLLPGQGHFFEGPALDDLCARVSGFLSGVL